MTLAPTSVVPGAKTENPAARILSSSASRIIGTALALFLLAMPCPLVAAGWTITGSMVTPREEHTATLLPNGTVLLTGGAVYGNNNVLATSELYDPAQGKWTPTGSLSTARMLHTTTLLPNGKVLVAGGAVSISDNPILAASCEIYDPATGIWTTTGSPAKTRVTHTATLLADGKVLVAGGMNLSELHNSAEVYDPMTGQWQTAGSLRFPRGSHVAVLLADGKVLVAGGTKGNRDSLEKSAELYDPASLTWSITGSPLSTHAFAQATLLADGRVLMAGGWNGSDYTPGAELYDPASGTWRATGSFTTGRGFYGMSLLADRKVLAVGGTTVVGTRGAALDSVELYDPAAGTWSSAGTLASARIYPTATLLLSGRVLVAGGNSGSSTLSSAELYEPPSLPIAALFPHLAIGGGFSTAFTFLNMGDTPVNGTLILTGQDGAPLNAALAASAQTSDPADTHPALASAGSLTIPPGGAKTITATALNAADSTKVGWARVESTGGKLVGVANFQLVSNGRLTTTAGVLTSDLVESATFPVSDDFSSDVYTGYAIANPSSTATITIKVVTVKVDGTPGATLSSITLGPGRQIARFLIEDPAASETFQGTAVLIGQGGKKFSVVALVQNNGLYSVIPVTAGKASHIN